MIPNTPRLIVTEDRHPVGFAATTWEQRQGYRDRNGARIEGAPGVGMTAKELIKLMGSAHVSHPDYKGRGYTLNPEPNLARRQPMLSRTDYGLLSDWKRFLRWAMR